MHDISLISAYWRHLDDHHFTADPAQEALIARLQQLLDALLSSDQSKYMAWDPRRYLPVRPAIGETKGLYVWGDVGRGKTFLLNLFFHQLSLGGKKRIHFHQFMRDTHKQLAGLRNTHDPLEKIVRRFAGQTQLLYLDEFHIIDIGDAMILAELLKQLLRHGMILVMSSNSAPQELYRNGLQRQRFVPAIALIEKHLEVFELVSRCDYRLRLLRQTNLYHTPADVASERAMRESFDRLITDAPKYDVQLNINGHQMPVRAEATGVAWFDFDVVCGGARAAADYLEIAQCYETVLVSGIPLFQDQDDTARRLINMIDVFYDCHVRLIASAADSPENLYREGKLAREFRRTASRLIEMRSPDYIAQAHQQVQP